MPHSENYQVRRLAHLTCVHSRTDTRIFHKMCKSLSKEGMQVALVVADGKGDEMNSGVNIFDVGRPGNRLLRAFISGWRIYKRSLAIGADVFHLHDPELIPIGILLRYRGYNVVFDSHEDIPKQILNKPYLPKATRYTVSLFFGLLQKMACKKFNGLIAATDSIHQSLSSINTNIITIHNYPILNEVPVAHIKNKNSKYICYVGAISKIRGAMEMVQCMTHVTADVKLLLAGEITEKNLENEMRNNPGWKSVNYYGFVNREKVYEILDESIAGLVILHPTENYLDSLPVKMFEYMSAGIPFIASDFPKWRKIVDRHQCGILVDVGNSKTIAGAIDELIRNPEMAKRLGDNGRAAVTAEFNWGVEFERLCSFYQSIFERK